MILYHATTARRGKKIIEDGCIKKYVERYYIKENNDDGYSTQGYVYLSNELTFSMHLKLIYQII